jgi:hypothetical protein
MPQTPERPDLKNWPDAELVIKANIEHSTRFSESLAPGVCLFGNKDGFLWLAEFLIWHAYHIAENKSIAELLQDHEHIDCEEPVNQKLSDEFGVMITGYNEKHRRGLFKNCEITKAKRAAGSPIRQLINNLQYLEEQCWDDEVAACAQRDLEKLLRLSEEMLGRVRARIIENKVEE